MASRSSAKICAMVLRDCQTYYSSAADPGRYYHRESCVTYDSGRGPRLGMFTAAKELRLLVGDFPAGGRKGIDEILFRND